MIGGAKVDEVRLPRDNAGVGDEKSLVVSTSKSYLTGVLGSVTSFQSNLGVLSVVDDAFAGNESVGATGAVASVGVATPPSTTDTVSESEFDTYISLLEGLKATPLGPSPTGIVADTVVSSITDTVSERLFAT